MNEYTTNILRAVQQECLTMMRPQQYSVYIISMPHQVLRRERMVSMMRRIGIHSFEFVTPVKLSDVHKYAAYAGKLPPGYASLNITVAEKVFGMHQARILNGRATPGPFLVLEDDAIERVPAETIRSSIDAIIASLVGSDPSNSKSDPSNSKSDQTWDMVYLEYCMEHCQESRDTRVHVVPANKPYCTAATLYNSASIPTIRQCIKDQGLLIDFSYAKCIVQRELRAFVAMPALFAQDASYGVGDLAHLSPAHVQWWLNLIIEMYPDSKGKTADRRPRLPACWNSRELLDFVRWERVICILFICIASVAMVGIVVASK